MSLPLEPFSLAIGTVVGAWKDIAKTRIEQMTAVLRQTKENNKDTQNARDAAKGNKELQFTKRVVMLMMTATFCALHLGIDVPGLFDHAAHTVIGYTAIEPKFLFFGEKEVVHWVTVNGPALTPAFSNMYSFMVGYYFGSGGTRASK